MKRHLRWSVPALAAAALAAVGCRSTGQPAPAPASRPAPGTTASAAAPHAPASPPPRDAPLIARTLAKTTRLRHLEAARAVPGKTLPRDQLIARVKEHVAREIPSVEIEREGLVLRLLGFVPDRFDYAKEMFALLEAQLAGFYEPEDGTMYMAGDLDGINAEATLAHELVHALQDQHWDLKKRSKYQPGQSDRQGALAALAEGDATSAMADYIVAKADPARSALDVPEEVFTEQVLSSVSAGTGANTPHVMQTALVAPYVDGLVFVNTLRRRGGWSLVDKAWDDPPATTEQILHVEKWEAKEPALDVARPPGATLGAGWSLVDEDTYGEQGLRLMFEEWMPLAEARTAASAWGGDRGALFASGRKLALALRVRYDAARGAKKEAFAERAFKMLETALVTKFYAPSSAGAQTAPPLLVKDTNSMCIDRAALGPLAIERAGRDVILIAGPVAFDHGSKPAGDCVLAKRWMSEIASGS